MDLQDQLDRLPEDVADELSRYHFDRPRFERLAARLRASEPTDNRVRGAVTAPTAGDVRFLPEAGSPDYARCEARGLEALARGEVALIVLAGGMATRMGGVVKGLVEALPGRTFLDQRLAEVDAMTRRTGRPLPLWLMTSSATDADLRRTLGARLDGERVATFPQQLSLRLRPDGKLFLDARGRPSLHAPGHGDLVDALRESGLLRRFVAQGGRVVMVTNIDNLGATVDAAIVGFHLEHGSPVTCEVVDKVGSDRGGIPVRVDGRRVILEEFRLPAGFDPAEVRVFNTNTFLFDARALAALDLEWTFFFVTKDVEGIPAVQFERLIGEVTSQLDTVFLHVPRHGVESRFLPAKDPNELAARQSEIAAVAHARGIL
ncbi:MAG: UTP--glucose-1-phosphate uridylyltransferase [Polyangiaceae bacterium]|nr:UTP--glucose-1-phosphate uridylyltransferase [Polyangiaceae bacterium]